MKLREYIYTLDSSSNISNSSDSSNSINIKEKQNAYIDKNSDAYYLTYPLHLSDLIESFDKMLIRQQITNKVYVTDDDKKKKE